jgi:hypothetical protein
MVTNFGVFTELKVENTEPKPWCFAKIFPLGSFLSKTAPLFLIVPVR